MNSRLPEVLKGFASRLQMREIMGVGHGVEVGVEKAVTRVAGRFCCSQFFFKGTVGTPRRDRRPHAQELR